YYGSRRAFEERLTQYEAAAEQAEPKSSKSAEDISRLILEGLRQIESFPNAGVDVVAYGFGAGWDAMLTFAPGSTTLRRATSYRKVLPDIVAELRKRFELS